MMKVKAERKFLKELFENKIKEICSIVYVTSTSPLKLAHFTGETLTPSYSFVDPSTLRTDDTVIVAESIGYTVIVAKVWNLK